MPSINFEDEKAAFRKFYDEKQTLLVQSCESYRTLIKALLTSEAIAVSKVEARVKDREECIRKFFRKYLPALEEQRQPYEIAPHITDLIGLRVVCLYEDELAVVAELLRSHLTVISVTDKVGEMENSEGRFGYKGLHMDLRLAVPRTDMPEYKLYSDFPFEVQLRTIVQDSWSVLDHKIKYKKAIPIALKRRINLLAALFELADREFRQIRDETAAAIEAEQAGPEPESELGAESELEGASANEQPELEGIQSAPESKPAQAARPAAASELTVFSFLRIAQHFFKAFTFEPHKADGFVQEILQWQPSITRRDFNEHLRSTFGRVKQYKNDFESRDPSHTMNPFTVMRHCLYLADPGVFGSALTAVARASFDSWLQEQSADASTKLTEAN
ncbi:(p)ppGpp synthetase [Roseateles sp.]|uniref:GTP pyrophosphokinase n=1 Tax=Roseateles sp. TaxID=1971397 RepID=UPI0031E25152